MRFLRTVSTRRLLAIVAGLVIAAVAGTAIAVAASNGGPVPPRESLAKALHQAAAAPPVSGISGRISFTNNLINSANLQGPSDPILNGASGRFWVSNDGRARLELQGDGHDAQVVVSNGKFWIYDPMTNTVYQGSLPAQSTSSGSTATKETIPSVAQIQATLSQLLQHINIAGPMQRNVAGQPAYKVRITPKHDGGLLGSIQLAWDATHGVPLGIAIYSTQSNTPVLELKATHISYGKVSTRDLSIKAPHGAKTVQVAPAADQSTKAGKTATKHQTTVTTPAAVQAHLPFTLAAPPTLVGIPRQSVELLSWGGSPAALVTYGQGLGGIAVIERTAPANQTSSQSPSQGGGGQPGLTLPTVAINTHTTGQELPTALGTVIRATSGGVEYTLLGSVLPQALEPAAKALVP